MPQQEAKHAPYSVEKTDSFSNELGRQGPENIATVEEAIAAIAADPAAPKLKEPYEWLSPRKVPGQQLPLTIVPKRLRLERSGFELTYTVRAYERRVIMEDLNRSWTYRLPQFQPFG